MEKRYVSLGDDIARLVGELLKNPETGVSLGGGLRKVRLSIESKGKGKRGGGRVITFTVVTSQVSTDLFLITIYDKSEQDTISLETIDSLLIKNGLI